MGTVSTRQKDGRMDHGQRLHIPSRPGRGTRVTVTVPHGKSAFIGEGKAVGAI